MGVRAGPGVLDCGVRCTPRDIMCQGHVTIVCVNKASRLTWGAPNFQLVLLGVCRGDGLPGVDSVKLAFQSCRGRGLAMLILPKEELAGATSFTVFIMPVKGLTRHYAIVGA